MRATFIIFFVIVSFSAGVVNADTINIPADYPTIQAGIDAAVNGDNVLVAPGTYFENIDFIGKAIVVESEHGPGATVIDGGQANTVVIFINQEDEDSVLRGFTLTNGYADRGGGVRCGKDSSPIIEGNTITNNTVYKGGGGIFCVTASPMIRDNIITNNATEVGYAGAGISMMTFCAATITGNIITRNSPNGILAHNSMPPGGPAPVITISNNYIAHNTTPNYGGGIQMFNARAMITDNTVLDNSAGLYGGGIYLWQNRSSIIHNEIAGNASGKSGGGICCRGVAGPATIAGNVIWGNTADKMGGGVSAQKGIQVVLIDNMIFRNSSGDYGGGIFCGNAGPIITGNTLVENMAVNAGGAISCRNYAWPTVTNTILWNNPAPEGQISLGKDGKPSYLDISYSDLQGGQSSIDIEPGCTLVWGSGMIKLDPLFVDAARNDYHIIFHSPCRDSGANSAVLDLSDFEGDPRIAWDTTVDMGADEFYTHLYCTGQAVPGKGIDVKLIGQPANDAMLFLGTGFLNQPTPTPYGDWWLVPPCMAFDLGQMPGSGVILLKKRIPPDCPVPFTFPAQGMVRGRLSNLCVLQVR